MVTTGPCRYGLPQRPPATAPRGRPGPVRAVITLLALGLLLAGCATPPEERAGAAASNGRPIRPAPPAAEGAIDALLDEIGLRGQVGQHFIIPLKTAHIYDRTRKNTQQVLPAGYIVYPWNVASREQLTRLTKDLRRIAEESTGVRPFVAVDQEGGRVQALRIPSLHRHPPARSMGLHEDSDYTEAVGYVAAVELRSVGVNMNLAPVLDLYGGGAPAGDASPEAGSSRPNGRDEDNRGAGAPGDAPGEGPAQVDPEHDAGVIGDRAFDRRPDVVAELGLAYAGGLRRGGVISVAKHFPGHGATTVDSHGTLPVVAQSLPELRRTHLRPFAAAVYGGIPAVMTAHILYPRVDKKHPVSLSRRWLQDVLRKELGFGGVIMADAVEMRALSANYSLKEILLLGLRAGVDLFLITDWIDPVEAADTVMNLVEHGLVSKERIREGARRVLEVKAEYGLLPAQ